MNFTKLFASICLIAVLGLAACGQQAPSGGGQTQSDSEKSDRTIKVALGEFEFSPHNFTVKKGETVTFEVTNKGDHYHDFSVKDLDVTVGADPNQTARVTTTFDTPGTFEIICTVRGHASKGMVGELTVEGQKKE